jgi:Tol biopolymer transport system component
MKITFISTRRGDADVYTADPDGSGSFLITFDDGEAEDRNPSFTPDGRLVVFSSNRLDDHFQVYAASLNGSILTRITNTATDDLQFVYRPIPSLVNR